MIGSVLVEWVPGWLAVHANLLTLLLAWALCMRRVTVYLIAGNFCSDSEHISSTSNSSVYLWRHYHLPDAVQDQQNRVVGPQTQLVQLMMVHGIF